MASTVRLQESRSCGLQPGPTRHLELPAPLHPALRQLPGLPHQRHAGPCTVAGREHPDQGGEKSVDGADQGSRPAPVAERWGASPPVPRVTAGAAWGRGEDETPGAGFQFSCLGHAGALGSPDRAAGPGCPLAAAGETAGRCRVAVRDAPLGPAPPTTFAAAVPPPWRGLPLGLAVRTDCFRCPLACCGAPRP